MVRCSKQPRHERASRPEVAHAIGQRPKRKRRAQAAEHDGRNVSGKHQEAAERGKIEDERGRLHRAQLIDVAAFDAAAHEILAVLHLLERTANL